MLELKLRRESQDRRSRPRGERRRTVRHSAGWPIRYVVDPGDQVAYFEPFDKNPCMLRDLSLDGAGLELSECEIAVGDRMVLDLQLGNHQRASIRLAGEVRHATTGHYGVVTVGVEFVDVGDLERAILMRLLRGVEMNART
jgi:hypothetical protein